MVVERWDKGASNAGARFPDLGLLVLSKATKLFAKYKGSPVIMAGCLLVFKNALGSLECTKHRLREIKKNLTTFNL